MKYLILSILISLNIYCASDTVIEKKDTSSLNVSTEALAKDELRRTSNSIESIGYFFNKLQSGEVPIEIIVKIIAQAKSEIELENMLQTFCLISPVMNKRIFANARLIISEYLLSKYPKKIEENGYDKVINDFFAIFADGDNILFTKWIRGWAGGPNESYVPYKNFILLPIFLILAGANINVTDKKTGMSVLAVAAINEHKPLIKALIKLGANVNLKNNKELSFMEFSSPEIRKYIINLVIIKEYKRVFKFFCSREGLRKTFNFICDKLNCCKKQKVKID